MEQMTTPRLLSSGVGSHRTPRMLVTEFGRSSRQFSTAQRNAYYWAAYNTIFASARVGGPCTGALFWQYLGQGMDNFKDGYEVIFQESSSTASIISQQSGRINSLNSRMAAAETKKVEETKN